MTTTKKEDFLPELNVSEEVSKEIEGKYIKYSPIIKNIKESSFVFNTYERGIIMALTDLVETMFNDLYRMKVELDMSHKLHRFNDDINREMLTLSLFSLMSKNGFDSYTPEELVKSISDYDFETIKKLCPHLICEDGPYGNLIEVRNNHLKESSDEK